MNTLNLQEMGLFWSKMNEHECKCTQLKADHAALTEPAPGSSYSNDRMWEAHVHSVNVCKAEKIRLEKEHEEEQRLYEQCRKDLLLLMPAKAVWFKLPGGTLYLAKTSNNTMDQSGKNLYYHDTEKEGALPKLTTL